MKINSKKNIKKNRKHSRKNVRKNKRSRKNVGKYSRKNVMRGGVLSEADFLGIIERLTQNDITLITLNIGHNNIGVAGAQAIAEALEGNTTLTTLDISYNNIDDVGTIAITKALKNNTTLKSLDINNNNIGVAGAEAIAEALIVNTTLTTLDIARNSIDNEGAIAIAGALSGEAGNKTLTTLSIMGNEIEDDGAKALAYALSSNETLTSLDIALNSIDNEGAKVIAKALETNTTLTKLYITYNNFGDEGAQAIAAALKYNTTITSLDINNISVEIKNALAEALERNKYQITYVPKLKTLKNTNNKSTNTNNKSSNTNNKSTNTNNNSSNIKDAIEFIDTILQSKDIIKNKTLNNTGKEEFILKYKQYLSGYENISNFKKLISNNYTNGNKALKEIDTSNKYIINLHGILSNNIFKLPDNINIIFLTPSSYLMISCGLVSVITLENIKQYIENPYCANNNTLFKEAILYLGGQYCIDLNLSRSLNDKVSGIHYVNESKSKIEEAHIYSDGDHSFTLSNFLETGKDYTHKMFEKDSQYTFIVLSCREGNHEPNNYEYDLINKLVLYEITIKILNFYLHFINKDKRAKMTIENNNHKTIENNNNETIENKYNKCITKKHKEIVLGSNKILTFLQYFRRSSKNKGLVRSRYFPIIDNDTVIKLGDNSKTVGNLKTIVNEIKDSNKQEKFRLLSITMNISRSMFIGNNTPIFRKSIFAHEKQIFDIIKYIFQDKYDLMFEFIVYIDLNLPIINFGYFEDLKTKIDVSKITYRINISALEFIVNYLNIKNLKQLNISMYAIGPSGLKTIEDVLSGNATLKILDISYNEIGDEVATTIALALKDNKTLITLTIGRNNIGDVGAEAIAGVLNSMKALTILNISNNKIGVAGAEALAEALKVNKTLTTLYINNNNIGDKGAEAIAAALSSNKTLTILNISNNNINIKTQTQIKTIQENKNKLSLIRTNGNKIKRNGLENITQNVPKNAITYITKT